MLSIPARHKGAFLRFIRLPEASRRALISALNKAPPRTSVNALAANLGDDLGIEAGAMQSIASFLASLYRAKTDLDIPAREFARDFVKVAQRELKEAPDARTINWSDLRRNVLDILKLDNSLGLTAKAAELSLESERRLCPLNCRVLSDARPIFLGAPSEPPSAWLIQHVLKIAYHSDEGEVKDFYVAMDSDDLNWLSYILGRASDKEKSMRGLLNKGGITVLSSEED